MDFGLVTVAPRAQVAAARAMIESARRAGFGGRVHAFVIDLLDDATSLGDEWASFLSVVPDPAYARQVAPLGLGRLTPSVVPGALRHALREHGSVVYVAPGVHVLDELDDLVTTGGTRVTLVERPKAAVPDDALHPNEIDFAHARRFASELVGATSASIPALEWWRDAAWSALVRGDDVDTGEWLDRLAHRFGVDGPSRPGRFADWYSLGIDGPVDDGTRVLVDGHRLATIDLSGRDRDQAHRVDARRPLPERVTLSELPSLADVIDRHPFTDHDDRPPLPRGLAFDQVMHTAYEAALRAAVDGDASPPPNPYDDADAFVDWLQQSQFPTVIRVSRYLRQVYLSRPDLSRAFPEVPGRDTARYFEWTHDHGRAEVPIPEPFLPPRQIAQRERATVRPPSTAVNLVGFLDTTLGIGEVARRIAAALDEASIAHHDVAFARSARGDTARLGERISAPHDINIVCINPDSLASFTDRAGEAFFADRYTIGVWFWETEELPPSMAWAFDLVDEVWAASEFVANAIRARAPERVAVHVVTLPLLAPPVEPDFSLSDLGLTASIPTFVCSWDYLSVVDRKNPLAVIDAYKEAFTADEGAQLLLKSINADRQRNAQQRVRHAAAARRDIHLVDVFLSPERNAAVIARSASVVSLHRSEGLGLNLADAITLGVPTIATNYGGNLAFMDPADTTLIPYQLVPVGPDQHPYPSDAQWADPDIDAASRALRSVFDDPGAAIEKAEMARVRLARDFSLARAAQSLADTLRTAAPPARKRRWSRDRS